MAKLLWALTLTGLPGLVLAAPAEEPTDETGVTAPDPATPSDTTPTEHPTPDQPAATPSTTDPPPAATDPAPKDTKAAAQPPADTPPADEPPPDEPPPEEQNEGRSFSAFLDDEIRRIVALDLYGVTAQLPQGYLSMKWDWTTIEAHRRYNDKREIGPIMPPLEFTQGDETLISLDMGLGGHGGGHTFQFSYGIIDELDFYFELPFTYMNVAFDPEAREIDDQGNRISPTYASLLGVEDPKAYSAGEFLYGTLPALGRPTPATRYKARWALGDINLGFSWNYYRAKHFSAAITPRVFLPTGHVPHPNNNLTYATGPALEVGVGGWLAGFTQGYDIRLLQHSNWFSAILSTEFTVAYGFEQERPYPTNFVKPLEVAALLDPVAFPDLSELSGTFKYTPGWSMEVTVQLQLQLAIVGLGVAYGVDYSQEPELDGDPNFISMAQGLELLGAQSTQMVQIGASVSLLPLYIPMDVMLSYRTVVGGWNAIVLDNYIQLTLKGYLPMGFFFE